MVLKAMREMVELDPVENEQVTPEKVRGYVLENYGMDIAACGTVMADMVAPGLTQTRTSKVPLHLRLLERVSSGIYRLLPAADELLSDIQDHEPSPPLSMHPSLNHILYGPPGTGKTYSVIRRAARLIAGRDLDDQEAKQVYDEACASGRIRLVTFHQSFSYEDFMEGIRPVMDGGGSARFEVRDGVFKQVTTEALFACLEPKQNEDEFEAHWNALLLQVADQGELEIPGLKDAVWILSSTEKGNLRAVNKVSQKEMACGRSAIAKVWQVLRPQVRVSSMEVSAALERGAHFGVIAAVYNFMQGIKPAVNPPVQGELSLPLANITPNHEAVVECYLEFGPTSGWQLRADKTFPPYVLIIDEINRGNISRIFGELITLIEDDKRHGRENALRVVLPSSREPFTVLPNLFILGTMNTADKSLALLDVALRRRFEFEELAPDFSKCAGFSELEPVMNEINRRLELRKDRDHRIGHAFFMGVTDVAGFNRAFVRKVVPLLQEYFFNDIDGARFVLGEEDNRDAIGFLRPLDGPPKWQRNRWRWFTDEEPGMDCWARLQLNLAV